MSQQTAPPRAATPSRRRRVARLVLIIGSAAAIASIFGSVWAVRVGVLLAVAAAVVAVAYAWSEAAAERRSGAAALLSAIREHGAALTTERTRNGEVVNVLTTRVATIRRELVERTTEVTRLTGTVADLTGSVSTLRGEAATVRGEVATLRIELTGRDATIDGLRDAVAARDSELRALAAEGPADGADAEVHAWPRRVWADGTGVADVHGPGELPAVVDLHATDAGPTGISNYEPVSSARQA